jgi:hypothetical protein
MPRLRIRDLISKLASTRQSGAPVELEVNLGPRSRGSRAVTSTPSPAAASQVAEVGAERFFAGGQVVGIVTDAAAAYTVVGYATISTERDQLSRPVPRAPP